MEFTNKIIDYVIHIYRQPEHKICKSTQKLDVISYYMMVSYLRDEGVVVQDGIRNSQKVWKLTPRGLKVARLLVELRKEMNVIFEGTKDMENREKEFI